jgi:hypothetical protein
MDQGSSREGGSMRNLIEDIIGAIGLFVAIYLIFILI